MQCTSPINLQKKIDLKAFPNGLTVPCGKCLACRISRRREWTARIMHEISFHDKNSFVTLTYSDNYLPENSSLKKSDLQKFFKRLRKSLPKDRKVKYFAAGEYGDVTQRPHYHIIFCGLGLDRDDKIKVMRAWPFADWNVPAIYTSAFGIAERQSVQYVVQYLDKAWSGEKAKVEYEQKNREPAFRLLSQGIGKKYCNSNIEKFSQSPYDTINGVKCKLPRYYVDQIGIDKSELKAYALKKEKELVKKCTGIDTDVETLYRNFPTEKSITVQRRKDSERAQTSKNLTKKLEISRARKKI